jgi:hypothetical protein
MTRVIVIAGAAGSGKNTASQVLRRLNPEVNEWAFADPLKHFCGEVFAFSQEQLYGPTEMRNHVIPWSSQSVRRFRGAVEGFALDLAAWTEKSYDRCALALYDWFQFMTDRSHELSPRLALQTLGTEFTRDRLDFNVWVKAARSRTNALFDGSIATITDGRFNNEFQAARGYDWELWHLERPGAGLEGEAGQHRSEQDMYGPVLRELRTHHYVNDGSLDDLEQTVTRWFTG